MMTLQEYWKKGEVPKNNGITYSDGTVLLFSSGKAQSEYGFQRTSLDQLKKDDEMGVEIEIYAQRKLENLGEVFCGACAMGNEGFVSCQDKSGLLQWSIYQDFANPFLNNLKVVNDLIQVSTEIDYFWEIPLFHPDNLSCISRNKWGY